MDQKTPTEDEKKMVTEVWDFLDSHSRTPATAILKKLLSAYEEATGARYDANYYEG